MKQRIGAFLLSVALLTPLSFGQYRDDYRERDHRAGKTAARVIGGAAIGAVIGGIAGHGKGAAVGAVAGGATGAIIDAIKRNHHRDRDNYRYDDRGRSTDRYRGRY